MIDVLLGAENDRIKNFHHDKISTFGIGKEFSRAEWQSIFRQLIAPMYFEGNTDTEIFNQWIEEFLILELKPNQIVIMDNVAFHKSQKTMELVE